MDESTAPHPPPAHPDARVPPPPPPVSSSHSTVSLGDATILCTRALGTSIASRARLLALGAFSLTIIVIAVLVAHNEGVGSPADALDFADITVFGLALPLFVLFAGAAGLGEASSEGTLVYLWLRPISRWSISLGGWIATVIVAITFTVVISAAVPLIFRAGVSSLLGTFLAGLIATLAYAALFSFFGTLSRFSSAIGLGYILVWESVIGRWGPIPNNLSIRHHAVSIAAGISSVRVDGSVPSAIVATSALVAATAALIGLTTLRLDRMDVR